MKVFSVFGCSDSGKTSSVERIIAELCRRKYSVGSIKDIHFRDFAIDREGTDTQRHKLAGSQLVTARGLYETDVLFQSRLSLREVLRFYDQDFVVLEGENNFEGPGIISAYTEHEIEERMRETVFAVVGRISDRISEYKGLPVINALKDVAKLVDLIEEKVPEWEDRGTL
ncbi:MAG: molybdopterin-guanine dinucleotide biosynthesis protein MobB [Eubacteriales bacterium]|nr:molybdopterin-guanine dinucleotide biosynthesis protein MobB [Eubacteriales bacterium]